MADYGFKYSVPGKKANGNINGKELGYSSKYGTLKTFKQGNISYASASGLTTQTIRHGLPYRPAFNLYYRDTLTGEVYQANSFNASSLVREDAEISVEGSADPYNLNIRIYNSSGSSKNVDIFYEIFYEDLVLEPEFFIG